MAGRVDKERGHMATTEKGDAQMHNNKEGVHSDDSEGMHRGEKEGMCGCNSKRECIAMTRECTAMMSAMMRNALR
jgi:hypothetical protein